MKYQLKWCSWEITRRCNMNCDICLCGGFLDEKKKELTNAEAKELCAQIIEMGVECVVLTGGEPFVREDWDEIAACLSEVGVEVQIATNGYFIDEEMIPRIKAAGVSRVSISIDGTKEIHDEGRISGSYEACKRAVRLLKDANIPVYAATTVTKKNFENLTALKEELEEMGVLHWKIQLGLPFGNFVLHKEDLIQPEKIIELIDFCYETDKEGRLYIYPGESIGYYTCKEAIVRSHALKTNKIPVFEGCPSGITSLHIAYEGTILGISLCVGDFIEGNIRKRPLKEIWEDENAFVWRRKLTKEQLSGTCRTCDYAEVCLGGCPAVRFATTGDICGENLYCAYHLQKLKS